MRSALTTLGEVAGLGAIAAGFWMLAPALGVIIAGVGVVAVSFVAGGDQ